MSRQSKDEPVSVMHRLAGVVVDVVVLDLVGLVLFSLIQPVAAALGGEQVWFILAPLILVLAVSYILLFWTRSGRTPGMMSVGLRVQNSQGHPLALKQAVVRLALAVLPVPGFGLLWMLWPSRRLPLHDLAAKTVVVRD